VERGALGRRRLLTQAHIALSSGNSTWKHQRAESNALELESGTKLTKIQATNFVRRLEFIPCSYHTPYCTSNRPVQVAYGTSRLEATGRVAGWALLFYLLLSSCPRCRYSTNNYTVSRPFVKRSISAAQIGSTDSLKLQLTSRPRLQY
jgi:hypothetical protein